MAAARRAMLANATSMTNSARTNGAPWRIAARLPTSSDRQVFAYCLDRPESQWPLSEEELPALFTPLSD